MQIDFHHATTYVVARLAGFPAPQADIIAHACQYVDDATSSGLVRFDNGALYYRISSAHKMLDLRNKKALANHLVWIPFHFLPGNEGLAEGLNPIGTFINKLVCRPDSPVARQMVRQAIIDQDRPYGLHRLGVAMHVYADTWSHQGFAGVLHPINKVSYARETGDSGVFSSSLAVFINDVLDKTVPPLGHGRATVLPDIPFLAWQYRNGHSELIIRDNADQFCQAAEWMYRAMKRYLLRDPFAEVGGMENRDMEKIRDLFTGLKEKSGSKRHAAWIRTIAKDPFSFGAETVAYPGKGPGSWKEQALGSNLDLPMYRWDPGFLKSNWKLFHDALQAHRLYVINDLLPRYGICAA